MKKSSLFAAWGILYIVCAGLGFVPDPQGAARILLTAISVLFFAPPAVLLTDAVQSGDRKTALTIRTLAAASLGLTLLLLILSIRSAVRGSAAGTVLHVLLALCSAPMLCSNYWVLSLFLWAVLLMGSFRIRKCK